MYIYTHMYMCIYLYYISLQVGRGLAIGLLDLYQCNPWSRLGTTIYSTLSGLRNHLFQKIMADRKKGGGGETSNHIMKRCSNNKLDRE